MMSKFFPSNSKSPVEGDVVILQAPEKPLFDKKDYRSIQLPNGLRALLISDLNRLKSDEDKVVQIDIDSETDEESEEEEDSEGHYSADSSSEESEEEMSDDDGSPDEPEEYLPAAALTIGAGSFEDPHDVNGLMHFLEHMVFMGSEKYQSENFFENYVSKHGGSDNGNTEFEKTTFYFEVQEPFIKKGLDIFAQFFIAPLMKKEAIGREKKAVNSEFVLALPEDECRIDQLIALMANDNHPIATFPWGNEKTLNAGISDEDLRNRLHKLRKKLYCANHMTLVVQARESLDTMQSWVVDIFSKIPSSIMGKPTYEHLGFPFAADKWHLHYGIIPVKDITSVRVSWALPSQQANYKSMPLEYLSFLMGDEGVGSMTSYLKNRMWGLSLCAGVTKDDDFYNSTSCIYNVDIDLTDEGLNKLDQVLLVIFQYIKLLGSTPPKEEILLEIQKIQRLAFDYREEEIPSENVENLSKNMQLYEPEHYLTGDVIVYDFDVKSIESILSLMTPESCNVITLSKTYKQMGICTKEEKWFGTKYFTEVIPDEWIKLFKNPPENTELSLPPPNQFVCDDFSLIKITPNAPENPSLECKDNRGELWFKPDHKYQLPKTYCLFILISQQIKESAKNAAMMDLMKKCFNHICVEEMYPIETALYEFSVASTPVGLRLGLDGFNQKFCEVFDKFITTLRTFASRINDPVFSHLKIDLFKSYHNAMIKPQVLRRDIRLSVLQESYWQTTEKFKALENVDMETFVEFCNCFIKTSYVKMLIQGNLEASEAKKVFEIVHDQIDEQETPPSSEMRVRKLKPGAWIAKVPSLNQADYNSSVINYYQDQPGTLFTELLNEFLTLLMSEPVFDELRTQQQLGYSVCCTNRCTEGILGLSITVCTQANEHSVEKVDNKIDKFVANFASHLKKMPASEFKEYLETLRTQKSQIHTSILTEMSEYWDEIVDGECVFNRNKKHIELMSKMTRETIIDRLYKLTSPNNQTFRKLSIQVEGSENPDWNSVLNFKKSLKCEVDELVRCCPPPTKSKKKIYITDLFEYKAGLEMYPPSLIK